MQQTFANLLAVRNISHLLNGNLKVGHYLAKAQICADFIFSFFLSAIKGTTYTK